MRVGLLIALLVAPVFPALASDGVLEINQTCAAGPGCFPGDEPGLPVRILNSGSYVLTSNLVVPQLVDGITTQINATDFPSEISVSIDLNGFTISSTTSCSGEPLVCSPTSVTDGSGLLLAAIDQGSFQVRNGTIQGMAFAALLCNDRCIVSDLIVNNNGSAGILFNGSVRNVYAHKNGGNGIAILNLGTVQDCTAEANQESGYFGRASYSNNASRNNGAYGFQGNPGSTYFGNNATGNDIGLRCVRCTAQFNVLDNNSSTGIDFEKSAAVYGGNRIAANGQAVLNEDNAVQSAPNSCSPAPCP